MRLQHSLPFVIICLLFLNAQVKAADGLLLELQAGEVDRTETPIYLTLPKALRSAKGFSLTCEATGQEVPVQKVADTHPRIVWMLEKPLKAGQSRRYRLRANDQPEFKHNVTCTDNGRQFVVSVAEKPVLTYNHAVVESNDPKTPYYARSGYLHPVFAPDGTVVTDDFAPDHPHQHGIMFAWTNTTFEGRKLNFWDQKAQTGRVEHAAVKDRYDGPVCGGFRVELRHLDLTAPGGPKPVLDETWNVRVYNRSDRFLFDLESIQRAAGESPLQVNKYHYGGMAIRGHRDWLDLEKGDFLTSEGKTRQNGNHSRPNWVSIHGRLKGADDYSVTIFSDPRNFRAPQPVRLHPNKPYFVFAPLVLGPFEIGATQPYLSRYRYLIEAQTPNANLNQQVWSDVADPPKVLILPES